MGAIAEKCLVTFTRARNEATAEGLLALMYVRKALRLGFGKREIKLSDKKVLPSRLAIRDYNQCPLRARLLGDRS